MAERPIASVVVPSYNHERYLEEALGSVLGVRDLGGELELIVVDDGSSDGSVALLERMARDDRRLELVVQENRGAHAALNRGVAMARADFVFLLNSDDAFEPGRIPELLELFASRPAVVAAGSWLRVVDGEGKELAIKEGWRNLPPWPRPSPAPGLAELGDPALALLESNYLATTTNFAFRRTALAGLPFLPLRYAHDWDFFLGACGRGELALVEKPLARYRVHARNTLREGQDEGQARMRFEILWLLARHAWSLGRRAAEAGLLDARQLDERLWASLPRFARPELLLQLLAWRGRSPEVPAQYDALMDSAHAFTRDALRVLRDEAAG